MQIKVIKTGLEEIQAFRLLFLHENNFRFVCNKCYGYGWADTWLFLIDEIKIGYGLVWGPKDSGVTTGISHLYARNLN